MFRVVIFGDEPKKPFRAAHMFSVHTSLGCFAGVPTLVGVRSWAGKREIMVLRTAERHVDPIQGRPNPRKNTARKKKRTR